MKDTFYDYLSLVALVSTPIAAALFVAWGVWHETYQRTGIGELSIAAAIATAVTLEVVGMLGGHIAISLKRDDDKRWLVAALAVVIYTAVGVVVLGVLNDMLIGAAAFLLAPVVYTLVALQRDARAVQTEQREVAQDDKAWKRQQIVEDKKRAHELKLARIEARANSRTPARSERTQIAESSGQYPSDWRLLTDRQKRELAAMSAQEISEVANVDPRTGRRWASRAANLSVNGSGK